MIMLKTIWKRTKEHREKFQVSDKNALEMRKNSLYVTSDLQGLEYYVEFEINASNVA